MQDVAEANKDNEAAFGGDEGDPETFDDTDFYQTLLKEFLDNSQAINNSMYTVSMVEFSLGNELFRLHCSPNSSSTHLSSSLLAQPQGRKQRKQVDRRASKGRKIRYHVHEKLVNFMTPVELDSPLYASNLFANLFGGK